MKINTLDKLLLELSSNLSTKSYSSVEDIYMAIKDSTNNNGDTVASLLEESEKDIKQDLAYFIKNINKFQSMRPLFMKSSITGKDIPLLLEDKKRLTDEDKVEFLKNTVILLKEKLTKETDLSFIKNKSSDEIINNFNNFYTKILEC